MQIRKDCSLLQNQLSGYLLRKFKNSMGWQKLWVVFTNFCLFFYKTFQVSATKSSFDFDAKMKNMKSVLIFCMMKC